MPRCVDSLENQKNQSSAPTSARGLTKASDSDDSDSDTQINHDDEVDGNSDVALLPYIQNRYGNDSRRSYIDEELQAGNYGELLPCDYTCHYVSMSCPNIIQWTCPIWDITSQVDYGAFADSDDQGIGQGKNGGAGIDGQRWGGPTSYVATDGFGNLYCNAIGTDLRLRQENQGYSILVTKRKMWANVLVGISIGLIPLITSL